MKLMTVGTSWITGATIKAFRSNEIEIFACNGRDSEKTKEFAQKNGVERFTTNYTEALLSSEIEAVYIAVPNSLHYDYAKKAIMAGKHVFLEKPFCNNLKEAKELVDLAYNKGLFLFETNMAPHNPAFKILKQDIKQLGRIRMVEINFSKYSSKYDSFKNDENPNIFNPDYSGGALMDLGCYNISFTAGLFGLPQEAHYFYNEQKGIDTSGVAILKYPGFIVNAINGKDTACASHFMICGENGYIIANGFSSTFNSYRIKMNNGHNVEKKFDISDTRTEEIAAMKKMIDANNCDLCHDYLTLTLMEMDIIDTLRKDSGLKFKADI